MLLSSFYILMVLAGLLWEAFFALSEIALVSSDKLVLFEHKEKDEPALMPLLEILSEPHLISQTLIVGPVLAVMTSTLFFGLLILRLGAGASALSLILLGCFHLALVSVFGEIIPRLIYHKKPEETAIGVAIPFYRLMRFLNPAIVVGHRLVDLVRSGRGMDVSRKNPFVADEELELIRAFARGSETRQVEDARIIGKILDFTEIRVRDIYIAMDHVISVNEKATLAEAMAVVMQSGFSRIPVHRGDGRRIVGVLHAMDLIRAADRSGKLEDYYRRAYFVPEDALVRDLFRATQKRKIMMAIVVDREENATGIVTMEDILEEIFGEIEDEFDLKDQLFREIGPREYLVDARISVAELNEQLRLGIQSDGYRTLNGYILRHLRRIPAEGERFTIGDVMFKIELADERQVYKLFLKSPKRLTRGSETGRSSSRKKTGRSAQEPKS
ncbi:MAG: hemolysin family protein [bacterium]|nr:hemolysin family protein [bacterium]